MHEFCFDLSDIYLPAEQQNCPVIGDLYRFIDTGMVPAGDFLTQADISSQDRYAIMDGVLIHFYQPRMFCFRKADSITTAKVFYQEVITRYGCPKYTLMTEVPHCSQHFNKRFVKLLGIRKLSTSSYHPSSNLTSERFNRFLWEF